jgi:hypothetical protein
LFDRVLESAERHGMRLQLCLDTHHPFLKSKGWGLEKTGFHKKHGGPLANPGRVAPDFFTDKKCREAYRARLRYVVARYGYSTSVFAWEFWNEIGCLPGAGGSRKQIRKWHTDMARSLRSVDPWKHLITSSQHIPKGCPGLDFDQIHTYGTGDPLRGLDVRRHWRPGRRRSFHGEAFPLRSRGYPHPSPVPAMIKVDPRGQWLHDAIFSSPGLGHPATPMIWYHRSYIDKQNLYGVFKPCRAWLDGFDFAGQRARPFTSKTASCSKKLSVVGVQGKNEGLAWVRDRAHPWANRPQKKVVPVKDALVTLKGLAAGSWTVSHWDSYAGKVKKTETLAVKDDGVLKIKLDPVPRDMALRWKKASPEGKGAGEGKE